MLLAIKTEIISRHSAGTLPQLFLECIRRDDGDDLGKALRAELVALHNDGTIDVLQAAREIGTSPIGQSDFFFVQHVYVDIIPEVRACVPAMLAAVKALVTRAGDDLASGMPNGAFRTWAENGGRARATLAVINPDDTEDTAYLYLALQALAKSEPDAALDLALAHLAGGSIPARPGAAKAIGTLPFTSLEARQRAMGALETARAAGADDNLLGHILTAAVEISRSAGELESEAVAIIHNVAGEAGDAAIHHAASTLMFHAKELTPPIVTALAVIAQKVRIENTGTLNQLDSAAAALLQHKRVDEAVALIVPIVATHSELNSLERFDSFSHGLLGLDGEQLARVVVAWLLSLDGNLGKATAGLVGGYHGDQPLVLEFDAATLGLSEADMIVLAHRAIGYLFVHPITAASIVLSLIRSAGSKPRKAMAEILFDPLLINFSGELADWLKSKSTNTADPAQSTIEALLARLGAYLDGLRRIDVVRELHPSERERLIENHRQSESMRQAHKAAEKRSVIMSIVSRLVLLYGNRSISYFDGPDGKKLRNEMKLHSFSHSIETPRLDVLEPFELDYTLRVFRTMRAAS